MKRSSVHRAIFPVFLLGALLGTLPATMTPAFAGLTYTCDPTIDATRAGTCAYLNSTIAGLYTSTFSNINANIYIQYGSTGLGQSEQGFDNQVTWTAYLAALTASAQANGDPVQVAAVKALNSFDIAQYGNGMVDLPSALVTALGLSSQVTQLGNLGITGPNGTFCRTPGSAACYNGIITITNDPHTVLYYRTGGNEPANAFDFYSTVEHETNEILGTSSCVETTGPVLMDECPGANTPAAVDLYRYQNPETLVLIGTTPGAYFSYNGGQTNGANGNVYNTLDNGDDYADFISTCQNQVVQDAEACGGHDGGVDITNDGNAEINILNAVGYKLNPQGVTPPLPVTPALTNVLNGATAQSTIAANTYVAIYGTTLSTTNPRRQWAGPDFPKNANGTLGLPTSLDGTSVMVGGMPAYVEYVSPTQLNIITPATGATGSGIPVVVSLNGQASATFSITLHNLAPSFFAWDPATSDAGKYLIAQHAANFTNVGKVGLFPGTSPTFTTPAVPGETIVLYGTSQTTSPPIAPGIVTDKSTYVLNPTPTAMLGGIPATVGYAGLFDGDGLVYQFNVAIPANAPNGDLPLIVTVNGTQSFSGLITVQGH